MILKFGTILLLSASFAMLTVGCQKETDKVVKKDPVSQSGTESDTKQTTKPDDAKYREVSLNITGLT